MYLARSPLEPFVRVPPLPPLEIARTESAIISFSRRDSTSFSGVARPAAEGGAGAAGGGGGGGGGSDDDDEVVVPEAAVEDDDEDEDEDDDKTAEEGQEEEGGVGSRCSLRFSSRRRRSSPWVWTRMATLKAFRSAAGMLAATALTCTSSAVRW